jgi:site-specific recombinase XerD
MILMAVSAQQTRNVTMAKTNNPVYAFIRGFLNGKSVNSDNTSANYETDIRQFFRHVKNKEIENLTVEDLTITNQIAEDYKTFMQKELDLKPKTIARKISSVKKLYHKLEANDFPVREAWFNVDRIKGDSDQYGSLEWEDVQKMMKIVEDEVKGDIKSALLHTAVITCFRQKSLLSIGWDKLYRVDGVWVLETEQKGKKKRIKPITDEMYEKLMAIKERYNNDRIFPLQKNTVTLMMKRMREQLGLGDDVVFHSLKNCGINEAYELTGGDIMAVAEQGDHESFGTTMKHYMKKKKKMSDMVGLKIGQIVDISPLESLDAEQLLNIIKESSRSTQLELLALLNKK